MAGPNENTVRLAVLNPKGRDPYLEYRTGPGSFSPDIHAPINFHAYAACTGGAFFDSTEHLIAERDRFDAALVLIRRRCWITLAAVEKLKRAGIKTVVAWKECSPTAAMWKRLDSYALVAATWIWPNQLDDRWLYGEPAVLSAWSAP